jgi:RNA polymerase sigma factor (sigma-70 family)
VSDSVPEPNFAILIDRVRRGDQDAAVELIRKYEVVIRVTVRSRLKDTRIRSIVETMDIVQSVFAGFFNGTAKNQFDLQQPDDLVRLLVTMTKNKVASQYRLHHADKRNIDQRKDLGEGSLDDIGRENSPEKIVEARELWSAVHEQMTLHQRAIAEARIQGKSWQEVAEEVGGTAESCRKVLSRAVKEIMPKLGLELPESTDDE